VIVADTNVLAALVLRGPDARAADALLRTDQQWSVPILWRSEFRSVLAQYVRSRGLTRAHALALAEAAEQVVAGREHLVPTDDVLAVILTTPLSAYDAEFVALARALGVPLITWDKAILRHAPDVARRPDA
jgi:predicted nucleic acid-binding protein